MKRLALLALVPTLLFAQAGSGQPVPVGSGGTGATNQSAARINLGLGNVNNTSDANKPVSIATQAALDLKESSAGAQAKADAAQAAAIAAAATDATTKANAAQAAAIAAAATDATTKANAAQAAAIAASLPASYLDTDATMAANSNTKVPSQAAVRAYVGANATAAFSGLTGQPTDNANLSAALGAKQPLPTYAPLASTELILNNDGIVNTTTISGPTEFGLASSGGAGSRRHISADFSGTQTVTTDFAVYRNGATASALINEAMSGHQDIVIMDEGAGILRWYDNKFFAKDLQTEVSPSHYSPSGNTVKDHLQAIDTALGTVTSSGIPIGNYFMRETTDLAGSPPNSIVANSTGASESGIVDMMTLLPASGMTWLMMGNGTVATPTVDIPAGTYTSTQNVTISSATSGASIRYTTNGVDPTPSDTLYSTPVAISASSTLKAKAFKSKYGASGIFSAAYTIDTGPSYLMNDDLVYASTLAATTGGGGWVNSGGSPNWTFTPANSGYSSSLRTYWGDSVYHTFTATGEVWATIYFTPTSWTTASNILVLGDGTNIALRVRLDPAGDIYVGVGASGGSFIHSTYTVGTKYRLDVRAKKGTGATSEAAFYLSTTTSKGSLIGTITNGAYTTDISRIILQASANCTVIWNGLKIDDVVIP